MKHTTRLFNLSVSLIFLAWIAKMHFVFGGDYLFRIGTIGTLTAIAIRTISFLKITELKTNQLINVFIINSVALLIIYSGMMLKVSHIMNNQFEKDFLLDFVGIPVIVGSLIYNFTHINKLIDASATTKAIFYKKIALPWILFFFSFMLYIIYSVILTIS